nr:MAG TPA: holin [Caudoviricetes sp.]
MENVTSIIAQGVLSIAGALASYFIAVGVTYLKKKRESLVNQLGVDQYNKDYKLAQDIYYGVEQQFKFIPQAGEQKAKEFDKLLTEKIPGISQEELDHFREAIVGKVNAEVKNSGILAPAYDETKDIADVATTATLDGAKVAETVVQK